MCSGLTTEMHRAYDFRNEPKNIGLKEACFSGSIALPGLTIGTQRFSRGNAAMAASNTA